MSAGCCAPCRPSRPGQQRDELLDRRLRLCDARAAGGRRFRPPSPRHGRTGDAASRPAGAAAIQTAAKLRRYMLVRTQMSVITGLLVWALRRGSTGLELAAEWGVIAFTLNYIPFIGPLIATTFPTAFALVQFESWQAALLVFACLNRHPVRGRQLCRAAGLRQRARDLAVRSCCSRCSSGPFCGASSVPSSAFRSRSRC